MARRATLALSLLLLTSVVMALPSLNPTTQPAAMPESRGGRDLAGTPRPDLAFDRWVTADGGPVPNEGSITLYRWWTDTCPYCASSLPALEQLRQKYAP